MYSIDFEVNGKILKKTAKTEKEVRRLVYVYTLGSQQEKNTLISEIVSKKDIENIEKLIKAKKEKHVNL
jgi:hypothetical protein